MVDAEEEARNGRRPVEFDLIEDIRTMLEDASDGNVVHE